MTIHSVYQSPLQAPERTFTVMTDGDKFRVEVKDTRAGYSTDGNVVSVRLPLTYWLHAPDNTDPLEFTSYEHAVCEVVAQFGVGAKIEPKKWRAV